MVRTHQGRVPDSLTQPREGIATRFKGLIKTVASRRGLLLRRVPPGRHGDPFADQAALLGGMNVHQVLDVGAYHGETALLYRKLFPNAEIHCFEPVSESFTRLSQVTAATTRIVANRLALGDSIGQVEVYVNRVAATSSRFRPAIGAGEIVPSEFLDAIGKDIADSTTIDEYCRQRRIDQVEILKLDIQGGELAALRGAGRMLSESRVTLVYVEVLIGALYEGQGTAGEIFRALEGHGYRLYGLYNLVYGRDSSLYQMDAIFLNPRVLHRD